MIRVALLATRQKTASRPWRSFHLTAVVATIVVGSLAYIAHELFPGAWISALPFFSRDYVPVHWVLSLLPTTYAAYMLGHRYSLAATAVVVTIHTFWLALFHNDLVSFMAVLGILGLGLVISALAWFQEQTRRQRELAYHQLEIAHLALQEHIVSVERQARQLEALGNLAAATSQSIDMGTIAGRALDVALPALGAQMGMVHLYHAGAGTLFLSGYRGWTPEQAQKVNFLSDTEGPLTAVVARRESVRVESYSGDNSVLGALIKVTSVSCFCATPVLEDDQVLGVLSVACMGHKRCSGETGALLKAMGLHLGVAVGKARRFEETEREQAQSQALARVLQEDRAKLELVQRNGLESLKRALASAHPEVVERSRWVRRLCLAAAQEVNLPQGDRDLLAQAAELHDIGLLGLRLGVAAEEDPLTARPHSRIVEHAALAADFLKHLTVLEGILPIIESSHERWNGAGYPKGLVGEEIPYLARILAVADGYDWLVRGGPGRSPLSPQEARSRLQAGSGSLWEPRAVARGAPRPGPATRRGYPLPWG